MWRLGWKKSKIFQFFQPLRYFTWFWYRTRYISSIHLEQITINLNYWRLTFRVLSADWIRSTAKIIIKSLNVYNKSYYVNIFYLKKDCKSKIFPLCSHDNTSISTIVFQCITNSIRIWNGTRRLNQTLCQLYYVISYYFFSFNLLFILLFVI